MQEITPLIDNCLAAYSAMCFERGFNQRWPLPHFFVLFYQCLLVRTDPVSIVLQIGSGENWYF